MPSWKVAATVEECPPGSAIERIVGDRVVAIFNVDGALYALDGVCPHQGGPLGKGMLEGCIVTCPWHGWQFDVRDGANSLSARIRQPSLPVRVEAGAILIDCPDGDAG